MNPNDDRMIPITFEAYALRGRLGAVDYVAAIKPKDYWTFINMAERAGAPNRVAQATLSARMLSISAGE